MAPACNYCVYGSYGNLVYVFKLPQALFPKKKIQSLYMLNIFLLISNVELFWRDTRQNGACVNEEQRSIGGPNLSIRGGREGH